MRKLITTIIVLSILSISCVSDNKIEIDESLNIKIKKIISSYGEFINKNENNLYDPPIYEVTFKEYEGICYVIINTNNIYNSNLDGFVFMNDKLVTFNNTVSNCNNNLVITNRKNDLKEIIEFADENRESDIYDPSFWKFKIKNGNLILDNYNRLEIDFNN